MKAKRPYKFRDLINVGKLHSVMATFYRLTHIGSSILDLEGNIIVGDYATGWKRICMEFHRKHPETLKKCIESDTSLCNRLLSGEKYVLYNCLNGMVDSAVPIMIDGEHVANLFSGQYFISPPNVAFFREQSQHYGFDEGEYLSALNEVAVLPAERVKEGAQFLTDLAEMIGQMALSKREVIEANEQLENRVQERTRELVRANQLLQSVIGERERAEKALVEERQRLLDVFETLPSYVILLTADYRVSYANRVFRERFGESNGRKCYEYLFGRSEPCEPCETFKPLKTGAPHHWEWLGPDGRSYDIFDFLFTERDGSQCILETGIDITEHKRAEREIKKERQRLYDVLETLPVMICLLTQDYHIPFANRSFREKFGESAGRHCYEYCFDCSKPCEFCESYKVFETGAPHHWEVTTSDGSVISVYDFPFTDVDGSKMILEMDIDVTEQRKMEKALKQLNESLEQRVAERTADLAKTNEELKAFIYSISHDLRGPLRSIASFGKFLMEDYADKLDEQGMDFLRRMNLGAVRMSKLIEDLLYLSRISRQEIKRAQVDMSRMALSIASDLRASESSRNVEMNVSEGIITWGDESLIAIALANLIGNAWKFTSKIADARIEVGSLKQDGKNIYYVRDNGAGFDARHSGKMFHPFHRVHSEEEFEGTGIGLAIVERIIHRHGGDIWAEGEIGKGATFYFTLD